MSSSNGSVEGFNVLAVATDEELEEEKRFASMTHEEAKDFLFRKEKRLMVLERQLLHQCNDSRRPIPQEDAAISGDVVTGVSKKEGRQRSAENKRTSSKPRSPSREVKFSSSGPCETSSTDSLSKQQPQGKSKPPVAPKRNNLPKLAVKNSSKKKVEDHSTSSSLGKVVERILEYLPTQSKNLPAAGKTAPTVAHSTSMDDSESIRLPPLGQQQSIDHKPSSRGHKSRSKSDNPTLSEPSAMAIAGSTVLPTVPPDDEISVTSSISNDSMVQRLCRSPTSPSNEIVNDIWIPPPTNIHKPIFNTICIFPLHTIDQSTSTDDLVPPPSQDSPEEPQSPEKDPKTSEESEVKEHSHSVEDSLKTADRERTYPTALSHVAVSRPSTRCNDTVETSRPASRGEAVRKSSAKDKPQPATSLQEVARSISSESSNNPLLQLYLCFYKDLNVQSRHHLLAAAAGISMDAARYAPESKTFPVPELQSMSDLFEVIAEEVSKLEYTSYYAMQSLRQSEQNVKDLSLIAASHQDLPDAFYEHLREVSRNLGEVRIAEAWVEMLLYDSRAIFSRTQKLGIDPTLIGPQFSIAYKAFLSCQGANISLKKKLNKVLEMFKKYLSKPMIRAESAPKGDSRHLQEQCEQWQSRCQELEEAINDIQEENHELRDELTAMDSQMDRTPGAFLFYAGLCNPNLPETFSHHVQVLQSLKKTIDGSEHFDFITLKRRLQQCMTALPAMQQFFKKYSSLHKKWAVSRGRMFLDRRQIGADADSHYICPICNIDSRMAQTDPSSPQTHSSTSQGGSGMIGNEKSKRLKQSLRKF